MEYEVIKLGGSILKDRDTFNRAAELVELKLEKCIIPVCVVSAMKGVKDKTIGALNYCLGDDDYNLRYFIEDLFEARAQLLYTTSFF